MSGKVIASSTPWMRQALREFEAHSPGELEAIEAAIPDGSTLAIFCKGRPRPLGVQVNGPHPLRVEPAYYNVGSACWAAIHALYLEAAS